MIKRLFVYYLSCRAAFNGGCCGGSSVNKRLIGRFTGVLNIEVSFFTLTTGGGDEYKSKSKSKSKSKFKFKFKSKFKSKCSGSGGGSGVKCSGSGGGSGSSEGTIRIGAT